jgi:hypothetical protein
MWDTNALDTDEIPMPGRPLLSILIPTCNRQRYLAKCLGSVLRAFAKQNVEIVVQDSSDDVDREHVRRSVHQNGNLKYLISNPETDFSENFNLAYANSEGVYVCAIGDDDTINPELYELVEWADRSEVDAVSQAHSAFYFWPDYRLKFMERRYAGRLYVRSSNPSLWRSECAVALAKFLESGFLDNKGLPKVYGGAVRRTCLERICARGGRVFGGVSPDIYSSLAAGLVVEKSFITDYPLFVAGSCGASGTCLAATGKHVGGLSVPQLSKFRNLIWSPEVPAFYSEETVWAHSAMQALRDLGRTDLIHRVNLSMLYVRCLLSHPKYRKHVLQCITQLEQRNGCHRLPRKRDYLKSGLSVCGRRAHGVILRARNMAYRVLTGGDAWRTEVISEIPDIDAALTVLQGVISRRGWSIAQLLRDAGAGFTTCESSET